MPRGRSVRRQALTRQRRRVALLALLGTAGWSLLMARAFELQTFDSEWLRELYEKQSARTLSLEPLRGEIVDRHGRLLAGSANAESVAASPRRLRDRADTARVLARALDLPRKRVYDLLDPSRSFVWIERWVTPAEAEATRAAGIQGVHTHVERKRFYPNRDLGSSYIGFAGHDGEGLSGLEFAFDEALRGQSADLPMMRDGIGRGLLHWQGDPKARKGARVVLALDAELQHYSEQALDRALAKTRATRAALVAIDPQTGDVLALAERPGFNPNRFWLEDPRVFRARPFVDGFEPGSTLKPFGVAAALERDAVRVTDRFDCENGEWRVHDRIVHDHKPHGMLSVHDIIRVSSNIGAAKVANRLGSAGLIEGLRAFGFGSRTGSGFPGETAGLIRPIGEHQSVERANLAFGQGVLVTSVQLAAAAASLANGGLRVTPRLALRIEREGELLEFPPGVGERVVSKETSRTVMRMLRDVVANGSGTAAALPHHAVAGKTGTAQKAGANGYLANRYVASFLGVLPADQPRLVVVVLLDEPKGVRFGGVVAAPVFREVGAWAVERFGVPRSSG